MSVETLSGLDINRKPDLVLVNSPLRDYDLRPKDAYEILPPLGLGYIATAANHEGHNVGVIDAEYQGIGLQKLVSKINSINPRYVGVNVLTPTRTVAMSIARGIDQDINLVVGGAQASAMPEKTLLDFVSLHPKTLLVSQEGEFPVIDLLAGMPKELIPNMYWIDENGSIRKNQTKVLLNLDSIPVLNRSFLMNDPSIDKRTGLMESRVITSRGCPFTCSTCAGSREVNVTNATIRHRNPKKIAEEIVDLVKNYGCESIRFVDDIFITSEVKTKSILDAIGEAETNHLTWDANGRANLLARSRPEYLDYLKDHGAHEIAIGIESGSERLRKRINKHVTEADIRFSVSELIKRNIQVKGYFMIGLPTESEEETKQTIALAKDLTFNNDSMFRASIFIFRPYPGTKEWDRLLAMGYTTETLLSMHATGQGEKSKHEVLTTQGYAELSPQQLQNLLEEYNNWQNDFSKT